MWLERYHPETEAEYELIDQLVQANWRTKRSSQAFADFEAGLFQQNPNPATWSDEQFKRLALMQRYKTADINAFHKALRMVEFIKKCDMQEESHIDRTAESAVATRLKPKEIREVKRIAIDSMVEQAELPQPRTDGGCECLPCAWLWSIQNLEQTGEVQ